MQLYINRKKGVWKLLDFKHGCNFCFNYVQSIGSFVESQIVDSSNMYYKNGFF